MVLRRRAIPPLLRQREWLLWRRQLQHGAGPVPQVRRCHTPSPSLTPPTLPWLSRSPLPAAGPNLSSHPTGRSGKASKKSRGNHRALQLQGFDQYGSLWLTGQVVSGSYVDVVWCCVVWCDVMWCGVVLCGALWCSLVLSGVVFCVWCGAAWNKTMRPMIAMTQRCCRSGADQIWGGADQIRSAQA